MMEAPPVQRPHVFPRELIRPRIWPGFGACTHGKAGNCRVWPRKKRMLMSQTNVTFPAFFMLYGRVPIRLRDFAPGKAQRIATCAVTVHQYCGRNAGYRR